MITPYLSQQPVDDFGLRFAGLKYSAGLAAASDTLLTVPGNAQSYKAVIKVKPGSVVWVAVNAVASLPAGATFALSNSEMVSNGQALCREVKAGDVLHFITATASTEVSVVLYALGSNN